MKISGAHQKFMEVKGGFLHFVACSVTLKLFDKKSEKTEGGTNDVMSN